MDRFAVHLDAPAGRVVRPAGAHGGAPAGAVCGDLIRLSVRVEDEAVAAAG